MFTQKQYHVSLDLLETRVRYSNASVKKTLLNEYVEQINFLISKQSDHARKFAVLERSSNLLFDAVSDPKNTTHWRHLCFEEFARSVARLQQLADCENTIQRSKLMEGRTEIAKTKLNASVEHTRCNVCIT